MLLKRPELWSPKICLHSPQGKCLLRHPWGVSLSAEPGDTTQLNAEPSAEAVGPLQLPFISLQTIQESTAWLGLLLPLLSRTFSGLGGDNAGHPLLFLLLCRSLYHFQAAAFSSHCLTHMGEMSEQLEKHQLPKLKQQRPLLGPQAS